MRRYMLSVPATEGAPPRSSEDTEQAFARVGRLNEELRASGSWVFAGGLLPATSATVVEARGEEFVVTDGPLTESEEHIGGFWVVEAPDLDAALEWAKKATRACGEPVEVRPFHETPGG